jgi:hypothetical protein
VTSELALPCPVVLEQLLLRRVGVVYAAEVVQLGIGAATELGWDLLTTHQEGACELEGSGLTEDEDRAETVLAQLLEALAEATGKVAGLEQDGVLLVVLVVTDPERPAGGVVSLPEPGHGLAFGALGVGVEALPLVENERRGWKQVKRVLGLGLGLLGLVVTSSGGGGSGLGLLGLGLLLSLGLLSRGGSGHEGSGDLRNRAQLNVTDDGLELRLVDARQEPAVDVAEWLAESSVEHALVESQQRHADGDIGKSHTLTDQERAAEEVGVQESKSLADLTLGLGGGLWTRRTRGQ